MTSVDQFKTDYDKARDLFKILQTQQKNRKNAEAAGKSTVEVRLSYKIPLVVRYNNERAGGTT